MSQQRECGRRSGDSGNWAGAEARLAAMEAEALRQEALLGEDHPLVGKLWLSLSRAYQSQEPRLFADKAEQALIRHAACPTSCRVIVTPRQYSHRHYTSITTCDMPSCPVVDMKQNKNAATALICRLQHERC